jgi:hypothetical protein
MTLMRALSFLYFKHWLVDKFKRMEDSNCELEHVTDWAV